MRNGKGLKLEMIKDNSISVVVPAFNCQDTISRVIDSIRYQTKYSYIKEIIVVNDGSTDNTLSQLKKNDLDDKMVIISQKNGGVSKARNVGMEYATGEWIALCDSDDIWLNNKIEIQGQILNMHDDIDFLGGNHSENAQKIFFFDLKKLTKLNTLFLCFKVLPQTSTCIFKRKIYEQIGGYDESQTHAEDIGYFLKISHFYKYYYSPEQVVIYGDGKKVGENGLSSNLKKMHEGFLNNYKRMYKSGYISYFTYLCASHYENLKYYVRLYRKNESKKNNCLH